MSKIQEERQTAAARKDWYEASPSEKATHVRRLIKSIRVSEANAEVSLFGAAIGTGADSQGYESLPEPDPPPMVFPLLNKRNPSGRGAWVNCLLPPNWADLKIAYEAAGDRELVSWVGLDGRDIRIDPALMPAGQKICTGCGRLLKHSEFYVLNGRGHDNRQPRCKTCHNAGINARRQRKQNAKVARLESVKAKAV